VIETGIDYTPYIMSSAVTAKLLIACLHGTLRLSIFNLKTDSISASMRALVVQRYSV